MKRLGRWTCLVKTGVNEWTVGSFHLCEADASLEATTLTEGAYKTVFCFVKESMLDEMST